MKKTLVKGMALAFVGSLIVAGSAIATPLNLNRPYDSGNLELVSDPSGELGLQAVFNNNISNGSIDTVSGQSNVAVWSTGEANVDSYLITLLSADEGKLGIYSYANNTQFDFDLVGNTVSFGINDSGDLYIGGVLASSGFGNAFGFYWHDLTASNYAFTEDDKNNGEIRALTYLVADGLKVYTQTYGGTTVTADGNNDWILAFEDTPGSLSDKDFQDAVFYVEDMNPVPEPATMLLMGTGLAGLAGAARKRRSKKA